MIKRFSFRGLVPTALLVLGWVLNGSILAQDGAKDASAVITFSGDVQLAETAGDAIAQGRDPFQPFAEVFNAANANIVNLECVVSTKGAPIPEKPYTFQAHPRVLPVVGRYFRVVSLANNHTGDFGHEAFIQQLELLDAQKIAHIGGGRNCAEARLPYMLEVKGIRIALLGYNDFHPRDFEAGPNWPGVAWSVDEQVEADILAARTIHKADLVIPFMHWGEEYDPADDRQKALARKMIDAGADLVVGGHPHVTQGAEYYKGKLIVYSLGNFVFNGFNKSGTRTGWVLRLRLDKKGLMNWDTVVGQIDEEGIPHPDKEAKSPSGDASKGTMEEKRGLVDSVFTLGKPSS